MTKDWKPVITATAERGAFIANKIYSQLQEKSVIKMSDSQCAYLTIEPQWEAKGEESPPVRIGGYSRASTHPDWPADFPPWGGLENHLSITSRPCFDTVYMASDAQKAELTLWHRRFAHLGAEQIRTLHQVTTSENGMRAMLKDSGMPNEFWPDAL